MKPAEIYGRCRMKRAIIISSAVAVLIAAVVVSVIAAGPGEPVKGEWSQFTVDQIVDHLGITGGNYTFEFDEPVYINMQVRRRVEEGGEVEVITSDWSNGSGKKFIVFFKRLGKDRTSHPLKPVPAETHEADEDLFETLELGHVCVSDTVTKEGDQTLTRTQRTRRGWKGCYATPFTYGEKRDVRQSFTTTVSVGQAVPFYRVSREGSDRFFEITVLFTKNAPPPDAKTKRARMTEPEGR
jgi:hypothetical protein